MGWKPWKNSTIWWTNQIRTLIFQTLFTLFKLLNKSDETIQTKNGSNLLDLFMILERLWHSMMNHNGLWLEIPFRWVAPLKSLLSMENNPSKTTLTWQKANTAPNMAYMSQTVVWEK